MTESQHFQGFNVLRIRLIRVVIMWPWFPYLIQFLTFGIFVALTIIGWGHFAPEGMNDKLYAKTNIVNLVIWGIWWPSMVWLSV
ncbi:MAG TPA: hypothetical protein VJ440_09210, partial [Candidatus Brocadiaceae bacterium]|nr:hypothetical protein [Candidatus Brocadiaceae bacterium]